MFGVQRVEARIEGLRFRVKGMGSRVGLGV